MTFTPNVKWDRCFVNSAPSSVIHISMGSCCAIPCRENAEANCFFTGTSYCPIRHNSYVRHCAEAHKGKKPCSYLCVVFPNFLCLQTLKQLLVKQNFTNNTKTCYLVSFCCNNAEDSK